MAKYIDSEYMRRILKRVVYHLKAFGAKREIAAIKSVIKFLNLMERFHSVDVDHTQIIDGECKKCGWFGDCVEARSHNFCPGCGRKVRRAEDR